MKELLNKEFNLDIQTIEPMSRKDSGHDNLLFKIITDDNLYFLKELPEHSKRPNTELIYSELSKCILQKSKMVLPIKSLQNNYLFTIDGKDMMLYDFIEHTVLNDHNLELRDAIELLEDLFLGFSQLTIPKHPFKTYENWFERGINQLSQKVSNHKFIELYDKYTHERFLELDFKVGNVHFDLNPFNIWIGSNGELLLSDFDNAQIAAYAKDIFDVFSNYIHLTNSNGIQFSDSDLGKILEFSKKYISNLTERDVRFLLIRTKLGSLYDPKSKMSDKELNSKMDDFYEFCSTL